VFVVLPTQVARADTYPSRPITITVPFPPGGANDILARLLAPKLSAAVNQPVIIENKGGGGGTIGAALVAKSKPDGYTLLMTAVPFVITQTLYPKLPYDAVKDFTPITLLTSPPFLLAVNPSLGVRNINELVALAKARPGKLSFGSAGIGSPGHLAGELINKRAGTAMTHVPYKGGGPAVADVVAGHISFIMATSAEIMPFANQGRLTVLGATSRNRISFLPQIPTLHESGLPNFDITVWYGISAPAGTPATVVALLNRELRAILKQPDIQERLREIGMEGAGTTPEQFGQFIASETTRWGQLVKDSGAKVE
jgi:tripartite-type tricarboxylate transporter receptor subunit TctC